MAETKSKLENVFDHVRSFFLPDPQLPHATPTGEGSADPSPAPPPEAGAFAERLTALEQKLEAVASAKQNAAQKLAEAEAERSHTQIVTLVETLRSQGRFPPMYERWGVQKFMERLAEIQGADNAADTNVCPTDPIDSARGTNISAGQPTLLAWFQDFLTKLPAVISFSELASSDGHRAPATGHRSPIVRFSEPARGMSVDPASVELAERAEALAAEDHISYAEALVRLREEGRAPTSA